jgi:hypothetical protein
MHWAEDACNSRYDANDDRGFPCKWELGKSGGAGVLILVDFFLFFICQIVTTTNGSPSLTPEATSQKIRMGLGFPFSNFKLAMPNHAQRHIAARMTISNKMDFCS